MDSGPTCLPLTYSSSNYCQNTRNSTGIMQVFLAGSWRTLHMFILHTVFLSVLQATLGRWVQATCGCWLLMFARVKEACSMDFPVIALVTLRHGERGGSKESFSDTLHLGTNLGFLRIARVCLGFLWIGLGCLGWLRKV